MGGWEFVVAGYGFCAVMLGSYAVLTIRKGKKLSAQIPESERRFLD